MRTLTAGETALVERHLALTRTVQRYALHRQRVQSGIHVLRAMIRAVEALPVRTPQDDEVLGRLLARLAELVPQELPAGLVVDNFAALRDANLRALREALGQ